MNIVVEEIEESWAIGYIKELISHHVISNECGMLTKK